MFGVFAGNEAADRRGGAVGERKLSMFDKDGT